MGKGILRDIGMVAVILLRSSGSSLSAPASKSAAHQFHGALALAHHPFEEGFSQMLGFHHHQQHHGQHPHQNPNNNILTADQIADAISTGGGDSTDYMRKRYREDLFKDESNQTETTVGASSSSPSNKQLKTQQEAGPSSGNNILRQNMMPTAAMWAVAPAAATAGAGGGNTLWMLPVSTSSSSSNHHTTPESQPMWPFPAAGGGNTIQAPLHFLPIINLPGANLEFQQNSRSNPLQLGSMIMNQHPQQQPSQHLGLGMSEGLIVVNAIW
ncbi:uncharacterized protein LOC143630037 [Bidens hawaiensis]|uniref:uncharacterized protein LOC143630037 n=1 Tax=Bidens hawaiensis TaxID=980011 RepID=UPI00404B6D99